MTQLYRKDFPTTQAAHDALPATGGTVIFDPITYASDGCFITKPNVSFICPAPGVAIMTYPLNMNDIHGVPSWANLVKSKGIFVPNGPSTPYTDFTQPKCANNFYCEGFEFHNAQIGSTYNGAGIRGQAKGLTVVRCGFINCQNGVLTNAQIDPQGRVVGFVEMHDCWGQDNGFSGLEHDVYLGPCARQIVTGPNMKNNDRGHHIKFNPGGGVAICVGGYFPDDDPAVTKKPTVHCAVDGSSGHVAVINCYFHKPDYFNSQDNVGKAYYTTNDREWSDIGDEYLALNNHTESYVQHNRGSFFWVDQRTIMKDTADKRTPPPITGYIGWNLCRYLKNVAMPHYDYGSIPFISPAGVVLENNQVQTTDLPYSWTKLDLSGGPALTSTTMIAYYTSLKAVAPANAQVSLDRTIAALNSFEAYDPMEQEDMSKIADLQAQLAAAQAASAAKDATITALMAERDALKASSAKAIADLQPPAVG